MDIVLFVLVTCFFILWLVELVERKKMAAEIYRVREVNRQLLIELEYLTQYSEDMTSDKIRSCLKAIIKEGEE